MRLLLILSLCAAAAFAGTWTTGVVLSTGGEGWESASAIDASGNSIAVWDERTTKGLVIDRVWTRSRPSGGAWGAVTNLSPAPLQTTYVFPAVRVSAKGNATAIWSDVAGVWTSDRPAGGAWSAAQLLAPGVSQPYFVMNNPGGMMLVWMYGAGPRGTPNSIMVLQRPAGGAWGTAQTAITAPHVSANHVALGDNGDALISWETYDAVCGEKCTLSNFVLHASREAAGSTEWQDSGALAGPDNFSHLGFVAVDAAGHAGMLMGASTTNFTAVSQPARGQAWTAPVPVYAGTNPYAIAFGADTAGNATFVLEELTASTVVAVGGNIVSNTWSPAAVISGKDPSPNQIIVGTGANGAAVVVWAAGNPSYSNNAIRAAVRAAPAAAWSAPVTLGKTSLGGPESVAVSANGAAIVTYASFTTGLKHTEYAANYKP